MNDTIAAIATPPLPSAIGILRLSGPEAAAVAEKCFKPLGRKGLREHAPRELVYGDLLDSGGEAIDRVLCTYSLGPASYTGEDTAEFQCHGSPMVLALGLEALFAAGARQALPGEFTRRAFLNGRLDLTGAEAAADLIHAESPAAVYQAAGQLGGALARAVDGVYGELAGLCDDVSDLVDLIDNAEDLTHALRQSSGEIRSILADVDALRNILDEYEPTLQEGVANVGSLSTSAAGTLRDLEVLLADTESLMKTSGGQLDAGTRQSLRGLAATLRQTAKAMEATGGVKQAKATINDIITDTWHEYTGDVNNILLMDATAEPVSLTDERNPAPTSIQVLIRTQEIKEEKPEEDEASAAVKEKTTFWGRVTQMFRDFWNAVTGIFR